MWAKIKGDAVRVGHIRGTCCEDFARETNPNTLQCGPDTSALTNARQGFFSEKPASKFAKCRVQLESCLQLHFLKCCVIWSWDHLPNYMLRRWALYITAQLTELAVGWERVWMGLNIYGDLPSLLEGPYNKLEHACQLHNYLARL